MSNAHTWTRTKAQGSHWSNLICEGSEIVATVNGTGYPTGIGWSPTSERRAQLIEAAPALLAALTYVMPWLEAHIGQGLSAHELDNIRATIAKATGEEPDA
jgi:hypothetical protein